MKKGKKRELTLEQVETVMDISYLICISIIFFEVMKLLEFIIRLFLPKPNNSMENATILVDPIWIMILIPIIVYFFSGLAYLWIRRKKNKKIKGILKENNANERLILKDEKIIDAIILENIEKVILKKVTTVNDSIVSIRFKNGFCKSFYLRKNFTEITGKSLKEQFINDLIKSIQLKEESYRLIIARYRLIIEGEAFVFEKELFFEEDLFEMFKLKEDE